jgi:hypothetical protein
LSVLFLFGEMGGKVTPGTSATAAPVAGTVQTADFQIGGDPASH